MSQNPKIAWSEVYKIGHEKVDSEHQKLFELTNKVTDCLDNKDSLLLSIKELVKYTKFHFTNEELYMKSINFPFLEEHKQLHQEIVNKVNKILAKLNSMETEEIVSELSLFIKENIINHILTEDKRVHHFRRNRKELIKIFQWKESYKIDNKQIDDEHKKLFDIALRTLEYKDTNVKQHIRDVLIELYDYMKVHFTNEEQFMKSLNYENLEEHIQIHEKIIDNLNEFIKKLPTLSIEKFERLLIEYMDVWLINHIICEDQKILCSQKTIQYNN